jgi:spore coat polysaccharide biosynthesis predicted glycosyltransferase SpsG
MEPGFIVHGDDSVKDVLGNRKFKVLNWLEEEEELVVLIKEADMVIVDSYLADAAVYEKISEVVGVPVFLDDTLRIDYPAGIIINWCIGARDLDYPEKVGATYLLGPEYVSLRKAFWDVPEKEIEETVTDVMVTFGGDDSKNTTPKVMRFLAAGYPALKKHIVIGSAFKNLTEIEAAADDNTYLVHSPDAEGMKNIMLASDIAITSGGQTLYELARMGVPTVAVAAADNQRYNVEGWEKAGFIENAGPWTDNHLLVNIADRFQKMMNVERRKQSSKTGRCMVPGNGADRIIDFILKDL